MLKTRDDYGPVRYRYVLAKFAAFVTRSAWQCLSNRLSRGVSPRLTAPKGYLMAGVESQKEVFRKYLESAGAIDVLVKGKYIKTALGSPTPAEHAAVIAERDSLKKQLAEAQKRIEELESQ
ncbi:hypothetical protein QJQ45_030200, partial [Haematococcus lacustris]